MKLLARICWTVGGVLLLGPLLAYLWVLFRLSQQPEYGDTYYVVVQYDRWLLAGLVGVVFLVLGNLLWRRGVRG